MPRGSKPAPAALLYVQAANSRLIGSGPPDGATANPCPCRSTTTGTAISPSRRTEWRRPTRPPAAAFWPKLKHRLQPAKVSPIPRPAPGCANWPPAALRKPRAPGNLVARSAWQTISTPPTITAHTTPAAATPNRSGHQHGRPGETQWQPGACGCAPQPPAVALSARPRPGPATTVPPIVMPCAVHSQ